MINWPETNFEILLQFNAKLSAIELAIWKWSSGRLERENWSENLENGLDGLGTHGG